MAVNIQNPLWLVVIATLVAAFPVLIGLFTAYIKISVVLGMLRSGIGAPQVPGGMVIMVLSLAMTSFVMSPVISKTAELASQTDFSALQKSPDWQAVRKFEGLLVPWREFMTAHAGKREIAALQILSAASAQENGREMQTEPDLTAEPSWQVLLPAFVLTEIKEGFAMGFVLLLPFLVIDLVVANVLTGMGMYMLSPVMISLPLKLIFFVMADGWLLLTRSLINSYN